MVRNVDIVEMTRKFPTMGANLYESKWSTNVTIPLHSIHDAHTAMLIGLVHVGENIRFPIGEMSRTPRPLPPRHVSSPWGWCLIQPKMTLGHYI